MRRLADAGRIRSLLRRLGEAARRESRIYLTGGATAVLVGWRDSTIDADLKVEGDEDAILRAIPAIKEALEINVELACPADFIPELPGWRDRSPFVAREGKADVFHYDPCAQALAKIERGHDRDLADVREMLARSLVNRAGLRDLFARIEPDLYRYPAIAPARFRRAVDETLGAG